MTVTDAVAADPIARFSAYLEQAKRLDRDVLPEPTAFCLATVSADGQPSARMLLLKGVDASGFVFYTNHQSRKAEELFATRKAAMCFHWQPLEVQVRVEGVVSTVSDAEADAYFASRPRGSQIGAWASEQSRPMQHADDLERRVAEFEQKFAGGPVPRPPHWSGFRLTPAVLEFWRSMPSRLHVRERYTRKDAAWRIERLFP
jgi:pyridoxamine 5'-phosphate oxidase